VRCRTFYPASRPHPPLFRRFTRRTRQILSPYPFFGGRLLGDITRQDIENLMDSLAGRKLLS
jgi:hypothetical protein